MQPLPTHDSKVQPLLTYDSKDTTNIWANIANYGESKQQSPNSRMTVVSNKKMTWLIINEKQF